MSKNLNLFVVFLEEKKIIPGIINTNIESEYKTDFKSTPGFEGCRPGDNKWSSSTLYMFGLSIGLSPSSANCP